MVAVLFIATACNRAIRFSAGQRVLNSETRCEHVIGLTMNRCAVTGLP